MFSFYDQMGEKFHKPELAQVPYSFLVFPSVITPLVPFIHFNWYMKAYCSINCNHLKGKITQCPSTD